MVDQVTDQVILQALKDVTYPGYSRDIVSFGLVDGVQTDGATAKVRLRVKSADAQLPRKLKESVEARLAALPGLASAEVTVAVTKPAQSAASSGGTTLDRESIPGVKYVVAIASGKGGVGKSTVTVNLACAMERLRANAGRPGAVGIMDCALYGPCVPMMMGVTDQPEIRGQKLLPVRNFNVPVMSIGLLVEEDSPVVWRGPLITKAIRQFAGDVEWGDLDVLFVDLPPGTGDTQLSMAQILPISGVIVVTTPQQAAVRVAIRGARMFEKVDIPLMGVVENMSHFHAGDGKTLTLFGEGGGAEAAKALGTAFLGQIPLEVGIQQGGDAGVPAVVGKAQSEASGVFTQLADTIWGLLERRIG